MLNKESDIDMFDFENAVANNLVISTHSSEVLKMIEKYVDSDFNFDNIIKTPEDIKDKYLWRKANWGTVYPAARVRHYRYMHRVDYYFETVFWPPSLVLIALSKKFPSTEINLEYRGTSWGMHGHYKIKAGIVVDHDEYGMEDEYK